MCEKELKCIDITGLEEIGHGSTSRVYRLDEDKIIKVFLPGIPEEEINAERIASRRAFIKEVPTAITYHMVRVGDGYGIIYEMIEGKTLFEVIRSRPDRISFYAEEAAGMMRQLHQTVYQKGELPDTRDIWWHFGKLGLVPFLSAEETRLLHDFLYTLPYRNTFIHGDFHPVNIMVRNEELILIDVGSASLGHPVLDLAGIYMVCCLLPGIPREHRTSDMILSADQWKAYWDAFIHQYFEGNDEEAIRAAEEQIALWGNLRLCVNHTLMPMFDDEEKAGFIRPRMDMLFQEMDRVKGHGSDLYDGETIWKTDS